MASVQDNAHFKKVENKVTQLQSVGLTTEDWEIIGDRLKQVWLDPVQDSDQPTPPQTRWRKGRSQKNYRQIQENSNHLFLAVVLAVPPTVCSSSQFQPVLNYWIGLRDYKNFNFTLDVGVKERFELIAKGKGYAERPLYLEFMRKIFPEPESRPESRPGRSPNIQSTSIFKIIANLSLTEIQYAYGLLPGNTLGSFLDTIEQGIYRSNQWAQEASQGGSRTGCLTIFIPTSQDQDGSCTIRVDRMTLMQAINKFKMTKLNFE